MVSEVDYLEKGKSEDGAGNFDKAIEYFDTALALNPQSDGAWYSKGNSLSNIGKDENAIKCYRHIDVKDSIVQRLNIGADTNATEKICSKCGTVAEENEKYCNGCGWML